MSGNNSKIIAFNYFGGKFTFVDELYQYFPNDFTHLIDLFAGSLVVSLNYRRNCIKTANEINSEITNFFRVLRDNREELFQSLLLTPVSKQEYNNCWTNHPTNNVENARRFYVRVRQSFFGLGAQRKNKGWHMAKTHGNCNGGETLSKWRNSLPKLYEVAEAIATNFQITNFSYEECISKCDYEGAFFYVDPPYPLECRASSNDYKYEFTNADHLALAASLHNIKGRAMISSYDCNLMNELYSDWNKAKLTPKKNNIRSGSVQECIWFNYPLSQTHLAQLNLFEN